LSEDIYFIGAFYKSENCQNSSFYLEQSNMVLYSNYEL